MDGKREIRLGGARRYDGRMITESAVDLLVAYFDLELSRYRYLSIH